MDESFRHWYFVAKRLTNLVIHLMLITSRDTFYWQKMFSFGICYRAIMTSLAACKGPSRFPGSIEIFIYFKWKWPISFSFYLIRKCGDFITQVDTTKPSLQKQISYMTFESLMDCSTNCTARVIIIRITIVYRFH